MKTEIRIEAIARAVHEAVRAYNMAIGDAGLPTWDELDAQLQASTISGIKGALAGNTPREQHGQWMQTRIADGWVYGPVTDRTAKINQCLIPYDELPGVQRRKDDLFLGIVRVMAIALS